MADLNVWNTALLSSSCTGASSAAAKIVVWQVVVHVAEREVVRTLPSRTWPAARPRAAQLKRRTDGEEPSCSSLPNNTVGRQDDCLPQIDSLICRDREFSTVFQLAQDRKMRLVLVLRAGQRDRQLKLWSPAQTWHTFSLPRCSSCLTGCWSIWPDNDHVGEHANSSLPKTTQC